LNLPPVEAVALPLPRGAGESALERLRRRGPVRGRLAILGPAFVASIAYVDPGNFATTSPVAPSTATCCSG
jgi:manganese transport protein